jgi:hypothetical protein
MSIEGVILESGEGKVVKVTWAGIAARGRKFGIVLKTEELGPIVLSTGGPEVIQQIHDACAQLLSLKDDPPQKIVVSRVGPGTPSSSQAGN